MGVIELDKEEFTICFLSLLINTTPFHSMSFKIPPKKSCKDSIGNILVKTLLFICVG